MASVLGSLSWKVAWLADHTVLLGWRVSVRGWLAVRHWFGHRWFDILIAFAFGLLAPVVLESHAFRGVVDGLGLGGLFHHGGEHVPGGHSAEGGIGGGAHE